MSFTTDDLTALDKAIKTGALRVKYLDREVLYRSLAEMLQVRALMQKDLGLIDSDSSVRYASHSKGLE